MKYAIGFIVAAVLALGSGSFLSAAFFFILAMVALVSLLPATDCNGNCGEGRECICAPKRPSATDSRGNA